ncbi:MAG TPA: glycoside hydrolase family 31 protein, partial [Armatimonadota bacterium]
MIVYESSLYRCEVDAAPFALRVYIADRLAMATGAGGVDGLSRAGSFCRAGRWRAVTEVLETRRDGETLTLRCATDDSGFQALLTLACAAGGLQVRWAPADGGPCEVIGDVYDARGAGHWYGHGYHEPQCWPLELAGLNKDPFLCNNVQSPIWLTSGGAGIVVPTEELLSVSLNADDDGLFRLGMNDVAAFDYHLLVGENIVDVFNRLLEIVGTPARIPSQEAFAQPIYSTWTEYPRHHLNQERVVDFARQIIAAGLPAGVLEIDEKYQPSFGEISFDPAIFPDPEAMLREFRALGFLATLWTSPFINTDSPAFTELRAVGGLVRDVHSGEPALFTWWGGEAALLDVTSPGGEAWYVDHLEAMRRLGFVGFKFDGGDGKYTPPFAQSAFAVPQRPQGYSNRYLEFIARHFPDYAESRVAWMVQREGLITREGGKDTVWGLQNGLHAMITQGLTQSMLGYPYLICDMVSGRVQTRFPDVPLPTDELFTRWTEMSAFTPM